jgi:ubiquinone/menaquinone biosynthesis C-methylase UbiE
MLVVWNHSLRKIFQNPSKILRPYLQDGMTILDLGCSPGFFSLEMAKMVPSGKIIAADLQQGMLDIVKKKVRGSKWQKIIQIHKTEPDGINLPERVDFILAFYVVHEIPDQNKLFEELKTILKPEGKVLIIEPKFHVKKKHFNKMIEKLINQEFKIMDNPKVFFSRSVLVRT